MFCYNCGKEIADSAIACVYCGKPVITEKAAEEKANKQSPALWIISMIFSFCTPFVGLILGLIGSFKYKDEGNKKRALSALLINSSAFLIRAVFFVYEFAFVMQLIKPYIDALVASAGK